MRRTSLIVLLASVGPAAALCAIPMSLLAQCGAATQDSIMDGVRPEQLHLSSDSTRRYKFSSAKDSIGWRRSRALAANSIGFRIIVSLQDCRLWVVSDRDTVLSAPVAVAKGTTLNFGKDRWKFDTPRGKRTVLSKQADPIWQPPDWLYAETASEHQLELRHVSASSPTKLPDGRLLTVRGGTVGLIENGQFVALPTDEHIVFGNTLYIPPLGSVNRRVEGELGKYRLDMGEGYLLHGTPYKDSLGLATTHGCVRLGDADIEWLFEHVAVGTKVFIF